MKKIIWLLWLFHFLVISTHACDICGCGSGNLYLGILPQFQKNFVGVRYSYKSNQTEHLPDLFGNKGNKSYEQAHQAEVWGRIYSHKRVQLFYFVPIVVKRKFENSEVIQGSGLGDVSILANYLLINSGDSLNRKFRHTLSFGGGVKFPTGRYKIERNGQKISENLQPGSGSFDFLTSMIYTFRLKKFGINHDLSYKINTSNPDGFMQGNRFTAAIMAFYVMKIGKITIMPQAGFQYENRGLDYKNKVAQIPGGGNLLSYTAGVDFYFNRFMFQLSSRLPVYQNLSKNFIQNHPDILAGFNIIF